MREIKFRAWSSERKEWLERDGTKELKLELVDPHLSSQPKLELMQYTGLKDKNGKEIYEGDITNYGVVEWCECLNWDSGGSNHPGFYFRNKYEYGERGSLSYHDGFDEGIEVLSNIYENPELLEVKE